MKQAIRYFSIGLLLSALLLYGYQFFNQEDTTASFSEDELIHLVEKEGYHVLTEDEYISYTTSKEDARKENQTADDNAKDKKDQKEKEKEEEKNEVEEATIEVKEDTYTPELADILVDKNIIDDRKEFIKYMDGNDDSEYLQLGTFKVTSEMTIEELAETFTTYPGD